MRRYGQAFPKPNALSWSDRRQRMTVCSVTYFAPHATHDLGAVYEQIAIFDFYSWLRTYDELAEQLGFCPMGIVKKVDGIVKKVDSWFLSTRPAFTNSIRS